MLKELIEKKRYSFHEGFDNWEDAVKASCEPLIKEGAVTSDYCDCIIKSIKKHGPYVVIAPNICIPHAQQCAKGVNETAICFMKTEKAVHFSDSDEHDAKLFFVLASTDSDKHLKNLSSLVEIISNEETVDKLLKSSSEEDLKELL